MSTKEKYQELQRRGLLKGTVSGCLRLRKKRDANPPYRPDGLAAGRIARRAAIDRERRSVPRVVALGNDVAAEYLSRAKATYPRLRCWELGATATTMERSPGWCGRGWWLHETGSNRDWSKRSTFRRGVRVISVATCEDFRVAVLRLSDATHRILAPRGYRWDVDVDGLYLRGRAGSYHPTTSELLASLGDRGRSMVAELKTATATRRRVAREAAAEARKARAKKQQEAQILRRAEREGLRLCLRDSLRAGNCEAGTRAWADRHGLDARRHYTPSEVLALANGDASRVALVVAVGLRRHREEMDRGFARLADHR